MFSYLRSKMKIVFIIVAAAFLVTIFAFWGMDMDSAQIRGNAAFSVNGDDISIRQYEDAVSRYLQNYGSDVTEELRRHVRKQAADDLIGQKLLEQRARKLDLYATPEELKGHLRAMFPDENTYQVYLARADARWWQFMEEDTLRRVEINRTRSLMQDGVWLSDAEWNKAMGDLYWEADLSHILFAPAAEVGDSDIEKYYRDNRHRILDPARVRARQILFKIPQDAPDSVVQQAAEQAKKILDLARAGKDFSALAKKYSDAPDAADGGDMGYFESGDMVKEVDDVVFAMTAGQISDLVRTEFGLHIFKLEDRISAQIRPWTPELAEELRPAAVTDTHWETAKAQAMRVLEVLLKSPGQFELMAKLHSAAKSRNAGGHIGWAPRLVFPSDYDATPLVGEISTGAAVEREIGRAAFMTPVGEISPEPVRSSLGWHIIQVHGRRPISSNPPTDTDLAIVRNTYIKLLGEQTLSQWIDNARKSSKVTFNINIER